MTLMPVSRHFASRGLHLHYLDWGGADKPPLLLLHGGMDHAHGWDEIAVPLSSVFHVRALDLRGHGDSDWSPDGDYSHLAHICDIAEFVSHLGRGPQAMLAHSMGANLALRYAGIFPENVSRLVAIDGIPPPMPIFEGRVREHSGERMQAWLAQHKKLSAQEDGLAARVRNWIAQYHAAASRKPRHYVTQQKMLQRLLEDKEKGLSPEQAQHFVQQGSRRQEDGGWTWKFDPLVHAGTLDEWSPEQVEALWANIACPVLLVTGKNSWAYDSGLKGRAALFRDASVVEIADASHWVHLNQPHLVLAAVRSFLGKS